MARRLSTGRASPTPASTGLRPTLSYANSPPPFKSGAVTLIPNKFVRPKRTCRDKDFQCFRPGHDLRFQSHFALSVEYTVEARPISNVEPNCQLPILQPTGGGFLDGVAHLFFESSISDDHAVTYNGDHPGRWPVSEEES